MKILVVSQYFYPENFRINDLVWELKNRGHQITVLTGIPNYPRGEFYPGYGYRQKRQEKLQGVDVIRAFQFPRHKGGLRLLLNYVSFVLGGYLAVRKMKKPDFDVIYAFGTSPVTQALPAIAMKKRIKKPLLFNVQDLWPENVLILTGLKNRLLISLLDRLVDSIYKNCDKILVPSHSFVERISRRKGFASPDKVSFWPQYSVVKGADQDQPLGTFGGLAELQPIARTFSKGAFHLVFTGNIGEGQGLELVVRAAVLLKEKKIIWHLVGDGRDKERIRRLAEEEGVKEQVLFHDPVPESAIPALLHEADAALLVMKPDPIFDLTIPAKFQTYLACRCAVLACVSGESRRIVKEAGCGFCTTEQSPEQLAEYARKMADCSKEQRALFQRKGFEYSQRYFVKEKLVSELEVLMDCIR